MYLYKKNVWIQLGASIWFENWECPEAWFENWGRVVVLNIQQTEARRTGLRVSSSEFLFNYANIEISEKSLLLESVPISYSSTSYNMVIFHGDSKHPRLLSQNLRSWPQPPRIDACARILLVTTDIILDSVVYISRNIIFRWRQGTSRTDYRTNALRALKHLLSIMIPLSGCSLCVECW